MAKATKREKKVFEGITLELSQREADWIYTMIGKMNGSNPGWEIFTALDKAGAKHDLTYKDMPYIDLTTWEQPE